MVQGLHTNRTTPGAGATSLVRLLWNCLRRIAVSVRSISGTPERVHFPLPMGLGDRSMRDVPN